MKILHVYKVYYPDDFTGIPRTIYNLAEGVPGTESHVLTISSHTQKITFSHHEIHQSSMWLKWQSTPMSLSIFKQFHSLIKNMDLVHYHFPWPWMDILHLTTNIKIPSVITYHSDIIRQRFLLKLYKPIMYRFLSNVNCIITTSPNYLSGSSVLKKYQHKVVCIPLGLPERTMPTSSVLDMWTKRVKKKFFLFVGALRYYKGIFYLIEAAKITGFPVVIAGKGNLDNLPPNIQYVGEVSDVDREALLELCHAFIFPSHIRSEAFGLSLAEAARAGKPMISCNIGTGTSFINQDKKTGYVIPPANVEALAIAMKNLWINTYNFGENARQLFNSLLRRELMCERYGRLYHWILQGRSPHSLHTILKN